jgi:DNA-binding NarL/FixJ family response regulator
MDFRGPLAESYSAAVALVVCALVPFLALAAALAPLLTLIGKDLNLSRGALELRERVPETAILIISQYVEGTYARELLADGRGGVGYLLKDRVMDVEAFVEAVRRVADGGTALDPEVVAHFVGRKDRLADLTPRETEVLALMAEGRSNAGIAESLVLTVGAVEKHVASILQKLRLPRSQETHRRVLAVLAYLDSGS